MIRINLLTVERKATRKKFAFSTSHKLTVGCTLVLIAAAGVIGWRYLAIDRDSKQLDADLITAQREATRLHSIIAQVQQFDQQKKQLQQRVSLIEQLRHEQTGPVHMLDQISRALPPTLWLTDLKQGVDANEVLMSGKCISITALTDFVSNLEASGYFKKSVEILNSETEPLTTPPGEIVTFSVRGRFQRAGDPVQAEAPAAAKPTSETSLKAGAHGPDTAG
jgi:type IV pilus assembly protein PilN